MTRNSFYTPSSFFGGGGRRIPFTGPAAQDYLEQARRVSGRNQSEENLVEYTDQRDVYQPSATEAIDIFNEHDVSMSVLGSMQEMYVMENAGERGQITESEHLASEMQFEKELFDMDYKVKERLFGWCPLNFYETTLKKDDYWSLALRTFFILVLIAAYSVGIACFAVLHQRIELCELGLSKMAPKYTNEATECKLGSSFINFKAYIQYRLGSYVGLLIPFLYIPFMIILDISNTAKKVWEKVRLDKKDKKGTTQLQLRSATEHFDKETRFNGSAFYGAKRAIESAATLSAAGHEWVMITLFLIFHIVLGSFSLAFDYLLMNIDSTAGSTCFILSEHLRDVSGEKELDLKKVGTYHFSMSVVFLVLTLIYLFRQWSHTVYRQTLEKQIRNMAKTLKKNSREDQNAAIRAEMENLRQVNKAAHNKLIEIHNDRQNAYSEIEKRNAIEAELERYKTDKSKGKQTKAKRLNDLARAQRGDGRR